MLKEETAEVAIRHPAGRRAFDAFLIQGALVHQAESPGDSK